MAEARPPEMRRLARSVTARTLLTLSVGVVGGGALGLTGFPAGYLSGSIVSVAAFALMGWPMVIPRRVAQVTFVIIGISIGAAVTPDTLNRVAAWPFSIAILLLAMVAVTVSVMFYLQKVHRFDPLSALYAASPGALSQTLAMAADTGADVRSIAIVQAARQILLALLIPGIVRVIGYSQAPVMAERGVVSWQQNMQELAILVIVSTLAALLAQRLRVPGGLIVGAMIGSGGLHAGGLVSLNIPDSLAIAAFIALGALAGSRFAGTELRQLKETGLAAIGAVIVATLVVSVFALAAALMLALPLGETIVAFAPGALEVMTILAFALHLDVAFVGTHHVIRFAFVSLGLPSAAALIRSRTSASTKD